MKQVPYYGNPGNAACALACYTMVAQYLLPDKNITFKQLGNIAGYREGYVVWGFPAWKWLMDQGIHVVDYDTIDYEAWAKNGSEGLRASVSPESFAYYSEHTYNLEQEATHVKKMLGHANFTYVRRKPIWQDVLDEFRKPGICDLTLNSRKLNNKDGFAVHRVVLVNITDMEVVFHDPQEDLSGAERRESLTHFRNAFESMRDPELARYWVT